MPYIDDGGYGELANRVRGVGQGLRSAISGYADRSREVEAESQALTEQNRVLHPAAQKWMQEVMNGRMSAAEAAAAAHDEIGMSGPPMTEAGPAPDPTRLSEPGEQGMMQGGNISMRAAAERPHAPPADVRGLQRAYTVRDLGDASKIAGMRKDLTPRTDAMELERLRQEGKNKLEDKKQAGYTSRQGTKIAFDEKKLNQEFVLKMEELDLRLDEMEMKAKTALDIASNKNATDRDIQKAKALIAEVVAMEKGTAQNTSSLVANQPAAQDYVNTRRAVIVQKMMEADRLLGIQTPVGPGSGVQGPVEQKPAGAPAPVAPKPPKPQARPAPAKANPSGTPEIPIKVRNRKTGQTGSMPESKFDPAKYERL